MIILNIETSTDACSAAIVEDGAVLTDATGALLRHLHPSGSEHSRELALMIQDLLSRLPQPQRIEGVAVSEGPGSYTGLRIGASVAKGIAYGMGVPLYAASTLRSMAAQVAQTVKDALLCPMIDARRMEVYNAVYSPGLEEVVSVEATVVDEHSFADLLSKGKVCFFGNGADKCKAVLRSPNAVFVDGIVPDAAWMSIPAEPVDLAYWEPFYLKEYQAKKSTNIIK